MNKFYNINIMAESKMYSSTPTPINTTVKSMASTGQNLHIFFNSEKDTKYKKIEGYKDPEKYLGKVLVNPELVGREYRIKFEKETITQPYMWFNDRIVEIEPLPKPNVSKSSLNKPNAGASMGLSNKVSMVQNPSIRSMSTALEASVSSAVKENNWVNVANSNENIANENNWVQVKKQNKQNKGTFGGKRKRTNQLRKSRRSRNIKKNKKITKKKI